MEHNACAPEIHTDVRGKMSTYKAEYIWIDGSIPTSKLRSKTKIVNSEEALPIWGFDGSSTNQATGLASDCVLRPVYSCPDPIRGGDDLLVMTEVLNTDFTPHRSNTRAACAEAAEKYADQEFIFGIEQEYTFFKGMRPLGFPEHGFPAPQGGYYCGVGADEVFGREVVEAHLRGVPEGRSRHLRHQRGGDAGTVGVPDRSPPGPGRFGRAMGRQVAAVPRGRGLRRERNPVPEARPRRLERCGGPHQLFHQDHEVQLPGLHRRGGGTGNEARSAHRQLWLCHRGSSDRSARDLLLQGVPVRCLGPRRFHQDPLAGGGRTARGT